MIILHRLNGKEFAVNPDMIKFLESAPDTIVTLDVHAAKDEKFMVKESLEEVIRLIRNFRIECEQWREPKGS
jgi:flagellar protein FlbD